MGKLSFGAPSNRRARRARWLAAAGAAGLLLGVISCQTVTRSVVVLPEVPGAKYVGSKECEQCHDTLYRDFATAEHKQKFLRGAIDGTVLNVPDTPPNAAYFGRPSGGDRGEGAFPQVRKLSLVDITNARILGEVFANPAIMSNTCFTVMIENCRCVHPVQFDQGEDLVTQLVPVAEMPGLLAAGKIKHSLVVVALCHFDLWQRGLKPDVK